MSEDTEPIRALYGGSALRRLFALVRDRLEQRNLGLGGWVTLRGPTPEERAATAALLGARSVPVGDLRVSLVDLDVALRSQALGLGLAEVLAGLGPGLVARGGLAARRRAARDAMFDAAAAHPALAKHPRLSGWLRWLRSRGILSALPQDEAERLLSTALATLEQLPAVGQALPVFASQVIGPSHALDRGTPIALLVDRGIAFIADREPATTAAGRRDLWATVGVALDAVSSSVLVLGLQVRGIRLERLLEDAAEAGEPLPVTLRMLRDVERLDAGGVLVRVCENRSIIEAAADELGAAAAPLVCLSGDPTNAGRRLLDALVAGGAELRYHGDFDWEGIGIANGVIGRDVRPWRYDADAYLAAVARTAVRDELAGGPVGARWDGRLLDAMRATNACIYEEHVLADLLADLAEPTARRPTVSIPTDSGPESDRDRWVGASRTRNYLLGDPLCDWLGRHGEAAGYVRDESLPGYDSRTDFRRFVLEQGRRFEAGVVKLIAKDREVRTIARSPEDVRSAACAADTVEAMRAGIAVVAQGVLHDRSLGVFGAPDLLVRADVLAALFGDSVVDDQLDRPAPGLGVPWHYRAVDIKLHTFELLRDGHASGAKGSLPFLAQVWLYNRALGLAQGFEPPSGYLLGRGWVQGDDRSDDCLDRLARVDRDRWLEHRGASLEELALDAVAWQRRLRSTGAGWQVRPEPSVPELYPNVRRGDDTPWHAAKRAIAAELRELTLLPRVNPDMRAAAHALGIRHWDDERVTAALLGITSETYRRQFERILEANRSPSPVLLPDLISRADPAWRELAPVEFYVDFETTSDLADDFSALPRAGGQELIFQIGSGWLDRAGGWHFEQWTAERLTVAEEGRIIAGWLGHLAAVCAAAGISMRAARLYHWSPAETSSLETAYNAARTRHPDEGWPDPEDLSWFDLLARLVRAEPIGVTGAFAFGLKPIARSMNALGLIPTTWNDGPADGLGAMVGAWWCDGEARRLGISMTELPLMREIGAYNEVDCRVMAETLDWLRANR